MRLNPTLRLVSILAVLSACTSFDTADVYEPDASNASTDHSPTLTPDGSSPEGPDATTQQATGTDTMSGATGTTRTTSGTGSAGGSSAGDPSCVPTAEECDGRDNDCDGKIDEDLSRACGPMAVGMCKRGTETCSAGSWGMCLGAVLPTVEACDAQELDENCNGVANEGCSCAANAVRECGKNEGVCRAGTQSCINGQWAMDCAGGVGQMGAGCECMEGMTTSCTDGGRGICAAGTKQCVRGMWGACRPTTAASTETCDNVDNDCDGVVDGPRATCPTGRKCATGGQCVECTGDLDCMLMSNACADGVCESGACRPKPKPENTPCSTLFTSGICISSACTAPRQSTIEDTASGNGDGQVNYASGSWDTTGNVHFNRGSPAGAYYLVRFTGLRIAIYGGKYPDRGFAQYQVCDANGLNCGRATMVDNEGPSRDRVELWNSGSIPYGQHSVKVTNPGTRGRSVTGTIVDFDFAIVN